MTGLLVMLLFGLAILALGIGMLRSPGFWLSFFQRGRFEWERRINRRLMTSATLRFQAGVAILGGSIFVVLALVLLVEYLSQG